MTKKELNLYETQTVRMCIQTFFNMYGVMPGAQDMIDWLGEDYAKVVPLYINEKKSSLSCFSFLLRTFFSLFHRNCSALPVSA